MAMVNGKSVAGVPLRGGEGVWGAASAAPAMDQYLIAFSRLSPLSVNW